MNNHDYNASKIEILEGLCAVRKRPSMYVGSTSSDGLHHLIYEIVDNAVDEALAGYCSHIHVTLNADGSVTVTDDGRGIPTGIQKKTGLSAVQIVFTMLHAGGKFDNNGYKVSGGLHGVGASVVNALSAWLSVTVWREGHMYHQHYDYGKPASPLMDMGHCSLNTHGTSVTFSPDNTIFSTVSFNYDTLIQRLRETAFLTSGLTLHLEDLRNSSLPTPSHTFHYEGGIREYVSWLGHDQTVLHPQIMFGESNGDDVWIQLSLQYNSSYIEQFNSFVNNIHTAEGGTHVTGFRSGLTRALNDYAKSITLFKNGDAPFTKDDLKEGLIAILNVKLSEPQFEGQTKKKLGNSQVRPLVEALTYQTITHFLEQNPTAAKAICEKVLLAQHAKSAARKARELTRKKTGLESYSLPGKLSDCSDGNPQNCELFIVEGDSAGGSAKSARCRFNQAILPLRGKILNVEKAPLNKIYSNTEIKTMITAIGTGVLEDFSLKKLRYHKIILMTDADVDGAHISTLLLTFLFRFTPELIRLGYVYLAQPPLYKVEKNKKIWYAYSDLEMTSILDSMGRDGNYKIQRYKGLGEMDAEQLWETTMNPEQRILQRITLNPDVEKDTDDTFSMLMGEDVEPRRRFIISGARYAKNLD